MTSKYVDVEEFVANYEYLEDTPLEFDDNFINHLPFTETQGENE